MPGPGPMAFEAQGKYDAALELYQKAQRIAQANEAGAAPPARGDYGTDLEARPSLGRAAEKRTLSPLFVTAYVHYWRTAVHIFFVSMCSRMDKISTYCRDVIRSCCVCVFARACVHACVRGVRIYVWIAIKATTWSSIAGWRMGGPFFLNDIVLPAKRLGQRCHRRDSVTCACGRCVFLHSLAKTGIVCLKPYGNTEDTENAIQSEKACNKPSFQRL